MSDVSSQTPAPVIKAVLHGEYLDLLMLAGRLARREVSSTDAGAASTLRAWVLRQLKDCRQKMDLRHFAGAPAVIVEAEIAIIAFLDSAAADLFGLPVWRLLREDLRNDYIDAGREARSVVDLGKYVYERLERLRTHSELLSREPEELLEVYDRCWRLGYKFSYEGRPSEFEDIKSKIADALSTRARERAGSLAAPGSPLEADPVLSPHLPALVGQAPRTPPLSPRVLVSLFAALLILMAVGLSLALYHDRSMTDRTVLAAYHKVSGFFSYVDKICPARPASSARPRRASARARRLPLHRRRRG
ncbi:MAG: DotU family type IV/VI secretion system protein [Polyangia bacterium]